MMGTSTLRLNGGMVTVVMANPLDTMVVDKDNKKNAVVRDEARATPGRRETKASKTPGLEGGEVGSGDNVVVMMQSELPPPPKWKSDSSSRSGGSLGSVVRVAQHPGQLQALLVGFY